MEILLWWLPPVLVTAGAMVWVGWLGRARSTAPDRSEAAQERFAAAILRELPTRARQTPPRPVRDRSTGIAVRPSQEPARAHAAEETRRSA
ncbi:hypothetical protein SAMN04488570_3500 [Nocardioides scoriae]|uniref:Uncharacterized protein n=1 Tax=Nocardioides scoriae TaxID=642780 RepID=A0A1H1XIQ8_9ACTN|nr:hypothetical protein [Nocardioides scoriae]SDT09118.1 hypothetical protein SAMN04488570_3500 [Nocardioides scoriae]